MAVDIKQPPLYEPSGAPANVTPEEVPAAVASGKYAFAKDAQIPVVSPQGEKGHIPASDLPAALREGFTYEPFESQQEAARQEAYGEGAGNMVKAAALGAADTASFGAASQILAKTGLASPEALKEIPERNPISHSVGSVAGVTGAILLPEIEGLGAVGALGKPIQAVTKAGKAVEGAVASRIASKGAQSVAQKILKKAAPAALGSAVEGAAFGVGEVVREEALGDPDLTAEKIASTVGLSALFGGALGASFAGVGEAGSLAKSKFFPGLEEQALKDSIAADAAAHAGSPNPPVIQEAMAAEGTQGAPNSLDELQERVRGAKLPSEQAQMPSRQALLDAQSTLPDLEYPVHQIQLQSMDNPRVRSVYKTFLESGSEEAKAMQNYEALQKADGVNKTFETIQQIAPGEALTEDAAKAGNQVVQAFKDQYNAEKKELAPLFKRFDKAASSAIEDPQTLVDRVAESIPGAEQYLLVNEKGALKVAPYSADMPFSKNVHGALKDLAAVASKEDLTLGGLRNLRETMRDRINLLSAPRDAMQIGQLRKSLLDQLEAEISAIDPDVAVRDTFRRYAQNEEKRGIIEKIFGGSVSDQANFAKKIVPEDVLNKVFADSVSVDAAKDILGPKFDTAVGNYLKVTAEKVSDPGKNGFSSQKFASFLRAKSPELSAAMAEKPEVLSRLTNLADFMRILPDAPSANPSGTARAVDILTKVHQLSGLLSTKGVVKGVAEAIAKNGETRQNKALIDALLKGHKPEEAEKIAQDRLRNYSTLKRVEQAAQKTAKRIESGAASIFKAAKDSSGVIGTQGAKAVRSTKEPESREGRVSQFNKEIEQVRMLSNSEQITYDKLNSTLSVLYPHAPKITSELQLNAVRGIQYLASKAPVPPPSKPLSTPWIPTQTEISKWNRSVQAVEDPLSAFTHIKQGTLSVDAVEAISTCYPKLYQQMQSSILDRLSEHKERLPYRTRLMLSLFIGQDLDSSMEPTAIQANQVTINGPSKQTDNQPMGMGHVTQGGLSKVTLANRMMTGTEKVANRP